MSFLLIGKFPETTLVQAFRSWATDAMSVNTPNPRQNPTRARWITAFWLCGLAGVLYLDRICMAQAIVPIQREFNLDNRAISYVMMAFTLAYGICEVPAGRMGDLMGPRLVLVRIVAWWSAFTMLTGACTGFYSLLLVRFLFGAGEAGALPNAGRVIASWFPVSERGRMQGLMLASAQVGGVLAPVATAWLIDKTGWRLAFSVFAFAGFAWAAGFWWWFRDNPGSHSAVNKEELDAIRGDSPPASTPHAPVPWGAVLANRGMLSLGFIAIFAAFYTYYFYSWFPKYLISAHGLGNQAAGNFASMVIGGSAVGMLAGGWLADRISRRAADPILSQKRVAAACYAISALCLVIGARMPDPLSLSAWWCASFMVMHVTLPNWWVVATRQAGVHVGAILGLLNGVGIVGALASQWFVGAFTDWRSGLDLSPRQQWDPMFDLYGLVLLLNAVAWWSFRLSPLAETSEPNRPESAPSPPG